MYKMLIADDEPAVRQYIRYLVQKHQLPFQICGEAVDGEQAVRIAKAEQPDLVMMDINMPLLNGLDAAAAIREKDPNVILYILTAYGQFDYAQRALQQRASGYLLKPTKPAELLTAWKESIAALLRRRITQWRLARMARQIHRDRPLLVKQRLLEVLQHDRENPAVIPLLQGLAGKRDFRPAAVVSIAGRSSAAPADGYEEMLVAECRSFLGAQGIVLNQSGEVLLIAGQWNPDLQHRLELRLEAWGRRHGVTLRAGVCPVAKPEQIGQSCREARSKREAGLFWRQQGLLLIDGNKEPGEELAVLTLQRQIRECLLERRIEQVREHLRRFFNEPQQQTRPSEALWAAARQVGSGLIAQYARHPLAPLDALSLQAAFEQQTQEALSAAELENGLYVLAEKLSAYGCSGAGESQQSLQSVWWVVDYIDTYYAKELTLELMAEKLFMSTGYICRIFKKHTGQGFIAYLTDVRLNRAKERLQVEGCSVAEAARLVGFRDASYFSSVFKKRFQLCPSQLMTLASGQNSRGVCQ
ncbi:MAG TPA: response regulator [Patescibacteria group bacterium]|nr:response regulator [Patescibacteria group bacterium]